MNNFRRQWEDTRERALDAFARVGESGWYILGKRVQEFEASLASAWGVRLCVGVASGLEALEIALRVSGCRPGDKVLTTPLSAFATTLAILKIGAIPIFADTDRFGLLNLETCRTLLRGRPDIRFLLPVHLYGNALDYRELRQLRTDFEICIVEDCAQSILATSHGHATGTAGSIAATSFYPTKNLGAMGDGGAVLTDTEAFAETARSLRDYGQTAKYRHDHIGYNSRLDELHSAILNDVYLPRLATWTARRRWIAQQYLNGIRHGRLRCLGNPAATDSCWHLFPLLVTGVPKQAFMAHLAANEIGCGEHYPILMPCQSAMKECTFEVAGDCAVAAEIARTEVSIPIHPYLADSEIERVIDVCNAWKDS